MVSAAGGSTEKSLYDSACLDRAPIPEVAISRAARAQLGKLLRDIGAGGLLSRITLPTKPQVTAFEAFLNKGKDRT